MSTKENVLKTLLTLKSDEFISGEELASSCSVSRAAIWKAIRSLEEEGFKIEAVTNRGYRLLETPDKLDSTQISDYLKENGIKDLKIKLFEQIDSTNSQAKRSACEIGSFRNASGELTDKGKNLHLTLFASESQSGGKGRLGRRFVSPKNCGVYFTLLYSPRFGVKNPALYTAAAAVSVCRAIQKFYDEKCGIKWVNDIFLGGKKICGILVEGIANFETNCIDAAVVGIGINLRINHELTGEITKIAGSVEEAKLLKNKEFKSVSKNLVIAEVIKNLIKFYEGFEAEDSELKNKMIEEYRSLSMLTGVSVTVNPVAGAKGEVYKAKVLGVSEEVKLIVETEGGEKKELSSGEVSLHSYDFV